MSPVAALDVTLLPSDGAAEGAAAEASLIADLTAAAEPMSHAQIMATQTEHQAEHRLSPLHQLPPLHRHTSHPLLSGHVIAAVACPQAVLQEDKERPWTEEEDAFVSQAERHTRPILSPKPQPRAQPFAT